jgi:hypothetical protein
MSEAKIIEAENGFILSLRRADYCYVPGVYVFNSKEDLGEFIKTYGIDETSAPGYSGKKRTEQQ